MTLNQCHLRNPFTCWANQYVDFQNIKIVSYMLSDLCSSYFCTDFLDSVLLLYNCEAIILTMN